MSDAVKPWDGALVRTWLESRCESARRDQAAADKRGYEARDDYDKAAAEEWVCRLLKGEDSALDQAAFAARLKALVGQDGYPVTGIHDDIRFERHVRSYLRSLAKMTKTNSGFENRWRRQ